MIESDSFASEVNPVTTTHRQIDKQTDTQHINHSQVSFWQGRLRNNRLHVWCNVRVYATGSGGRRFNPRPCHTKYFINGNYGFPSLALRVVS